MPIDAVIWDKSKCDVCDALTKHKGVVARAAKELSIARYSLYRLIKEDPDLYNLLWDLRSDTEEQFLDVAESIIMRSMSDYEKRPSNSLRAAMYVTNSIGKSRGWNKVTTEGTDNKQLDEKFDAYMNQMSRVQLEVQSRALKKDETTIINDNKS
jgi:hypothetical protein